MKKINLWSLLTLPLAVFLVSCGRGDVANIDSAVVSLRYEEHSLEKKWDAEAVRHEEASLKIKGVAAVKNEKNSLAVRGEWQEIGRIAVVSREEGSGARGAFEELVGVNTDEDNVMTEDAIIQNGNGVVATFITDNVAGIGYISFATFAHREKSLVGLSIDGIPPTPENMLSGDYTLVRPFNFVYIPDNIGIVEEAFIAFAASTHGLEILAGLGAVADTMDAVCFDKGAWDLPAEVVAFGGSTSTEATAMELIEEFMALFPQVEITYESVGSGAGIIGAEQGIFSLGFASREIHESELESGLNVVKYCVDGIVMVVNPSNRISGLTTRQLKKIYLGEITDWLEVEG